ncbi:MAG: acetylxylan esterase [Archangium sp.]|nr:acetylxylan esterase [Archangium sp.]
MYRSMLTTLVLAAACSAPTPPPEDVLPFEEAAVTAAPDPTKFGPYPVGVRTVVYEDTGRRKPDGTPRQLVTEIWYPAVQSTRGQPTVSYDIFQVFTPEQKLSIGEGVIPLLQTAAVRDAQPATKHGKFPLIIFSHGQAAIRWQSTYLTVLLASHGYIVASTDHEGGTLFDVVRGQLQNVAVGVETRPVDVTYLLNRLSRLKEEDPLFGLIDLEKIGVTGHSFGALTSLRVAAMDKRVKAIVPQAPVDANLAWIGLPRPVILDIPVHLQAAHDDKTLEWDTNIEPTLLVMRDPLWMLDITKGGHFTFSDLCAFDLASIVDQVNLDIPGADVREVLEDGCGPSAPPARIAQPLINHFAVAFFNAKLKGSEASLALMTQAKADEIAGAAGVATVTNWPAGDYADGGR